MPERERGQVQQMTGFDRKNLKAVKLQIGEKLLQAEREPQFSGVDLDGDLPDDVVELGSAYRCRLPPKAAHGYQPKASRGEVPEVLQRLIEIRAEHKATRHPAELTLRLCRRQLNAQLSGVNKR